jgi:putative acetyltransferase
MQIRNESPGDEVAIREITAAAFAGAEHSDGTEAAIVDGLRNAGALTVSVVAEKDGAIVGHAGFSPVQIAGEDCGWYGLGPVSVHPDHQAGGIGGAMIRQGLEQLKQADAAGCVVLGDPGYYLRFGFVQGGGLSFDGAPPEYFMQQAFRGEAPVGPVGYHQAFFES